MGAAQRAIEVEVSREDFFKVISDYQGYLSFVPEMRKIEVGKRRGNEVEVTYSVEVGVALTKKNVTYTLRHVEDPPHGLKWSMVRGEMMKSNEGSWKLEALGPKRTRATYSIEVGFGLLVPKSIAGALTERSLPALLEQFKRRAESLYQG